MEIPALKKPIRYQDAILLTGSCFTEHIAERLAQSKFRVLSNPNGILFNPLSVADSIEGYLSYRQYAETDLFYLNELWNSWDHHTSFSDIDPSSTLEKINNSQKAAHDFIQSAGFLVITLGSAFQYFLLDTGMPVSNNHRAPAQWFEKRLLSIESIIKRWESTLDMIFKANPGITIIFTISPVRHTRDGVIENNRSKARLIESVHHLCASHASTYYFPAYELLIDILRDYRYYDIDFVHPNFQATTFVWEQFTNSCISRESTLLMQQIKEIVTAKHHKPRFPLTMAHQKFIADYLIKTRDLANQYPFLNLSEELTYFSHT